MNRADLHAADAQHHVQKLRPGREQVAIPEVGLQPLRHLIGGLVCEGEHHDPVGHPQQRSPLTVADEGDAGDHRMRLARACAGPDHNVLLRVGMFEQILLRIERAKLPQPPQDALLARRQPAVADDEGQDARVEGLPEHAHLAVKARERRLPPFNPGQMLPAAVQIDLDVPPIAPQPLPGQRPVDALRRRTQLRAIAKHAVQLAAAHVLFHHLMDRGLVDLPAGQIVKARIIRLQSLGRALLRNVVCFRPILRNIGLKQPAHLQHGPRIKGIPPPLDHLPQGLIQLAEKRGLVRQILPQKCKALLHHNVHALRSEKRPRHLGQAHHLKDEGKPSGVASDVPLQVKAIPPRLLLGRRGQLALGGSDDHGLIVLNAQDALLPPALQLHDQDAPLRQEDAHVKFPSENLPVPVDDARIVEIGLGPGDEQTFAAVPGVLRPNHPRHPSSPRSPAHVESQTCIYYTESAPAFQPLWPEWKQLSRTHRKNPHGCIAGSNPAHAPLILAKSSPIC